MNVWIDSSLNVFTTSTPAAHALAFTTSTGPGNSGERTAWYRLTPDVWAWVVRVMVKVDAAAERGDVPLEEWKLYRDRYSSLRNIVDAFLDPDAVATALRGPGERPDVPDECFLPFPADKKQRPVTNRPAKQEPSSDSVVDELAPAEV
jgi:hypothetical protein